MASKLTLTGMKGSSGAIGSLDGDAAIEALANNALGLNVAEYRLSKMEDARLRPKTFLEAFEKREKEIIAAVRDRVKVIYNELKDEEANSMTEAEKRDEAVRQGQEILKYEKKKLYKEFPPEAIRVARQATTIIQGV